MMSCDAMYVWWDGTDRFSAVVDDGIVKSLNVEPDGVGYTISSAENTLKQV